ncbi:MAG TPA: HAD-IIB family hydrolase [Mariprofundaceae bacterium]|nr:HAD-IIB family hydrolase [Mariprofundaceae bacterium]
MDGETNIRLLLCSDLDRTLLPNGLQDESPQARVLLRRLAHRTEVSLAYVSGRHRQLVREAIAEYDLPVPDYVVGDVGTTIYQVAGDAWHFWPAWEAEIAPAWRGYSHDRLTKLFDGMLGLRLQEPEKQNTFKLSFYASREMDVTMQLARMQAVLDEYDIRAQLIWSVDEVSGSGLLDVLPEWATKYHAIRFLMRQKGYSEHETVFAGDSGNDLPVLASGLQSVLVANAGHEIRMQAARLARERGVADRLYLAHGGFLGMNGNYAAGVLEGVAHFVPEVRQWLA